VLQELIPGLPWAFPSGHCRHADCSLDGWYHPGLQSLHVVAPAAPNLPAVHTSQLEPPVVDLALPFGQLLQTDWPCEA
jgi:hypothetical protein